MVQNVAILIGAPNSDSATFAPLEACSNDVEAMEELIKATKRFNKVEILIDATSAEIQDKLNTLGDQAEKVGEIFLYFTGHGHVAEDEFYWVTAKFEINSPRSTGISQGALYEILRKIDASNTVIVQDACFSGQALFKGDRTKRLPSLSNLVQISSSAANVKTPGGLALSPFTDHFIEAASTSKSEGSINYLEVTQKLNDLLAQNQMQPHLGYQGTSNQIFCDDASYLLAIRSKYEISDEPEISSIPETETLAPQVTDKSILEDACKKMYKQGDIQTLIDTGISQIEDRVANRTDLAEYFDFSAVKHSDFAHATNVEQLREIHQSFTKWDEFVKTHYEKKEARRSRFFANAYLDYIYEPEYNEIYRIKLNASLESVHQIYHFNPKFDVLRRRELEILYIPGIFHVHVLWRFNVQGLSDWDTFAEEPNQKNWSYKETNATDAEADLAGIVDEFLTNSETAITKTVRNLKAL